MHLVQFVYQFFLRLHSFLEIHDSFQQIFVLFGEFSKVDDLFLLEGLLGFDYWLSKDLKCITFEDWKVVFSFWGFADSQILDALDKETDF